MNNPIQFDTVSFLRLTTRACVVALDTHVWSD